MNGWAPDNQVKTSQTRSQGQVRGQGEASGCRQAKIGSQGRQDRGAIQSPCPEGRCQIGCEAGGEGQGRGGEETGRQAGRQVHRQGRDQIRREAGREVRRQGEAGCGQVSSQGGPSGGCETAGCTGQVNARKVLGNPPGALIRPRLPYFAWGDATGSGSEA